MNKKKITEYEYLIAAEKILFYKTPAELDHNPIYRNISEKAKKLYSVLLSRHSLAEKMDLQDSDGNVYVLFPQEDIAELLNISDRQVSTLIKQLCKVGLIEKKKAGYGNYDKIYVKDILAKKSVEAKQVEQFDHESEIKLPKKTGKHHYSSGSKGKNNSSIDMNKTSDIVRNITSPRKKDYNNYKNIESSSVTVIDDETMQKLQAFLGYNSAVTRFGVQIGSAVLNVFYNREVIQGSSLSPIDYYAICEKIMNRGSGIGDMNAYAIKSVDNYIKYDKERKNDTPKPTFSANTFNQYEKRDYDFVELERQLLDN